MIYFYSIFLPPAFFYHLISVPVHFSVGDEKHPNNFCISVFDRICEDKLQYQMWQTASTLPLPIYELKVLLSSQKFCLKLKCLILTLNPEVWYFYFQFFCLSDFQFHHSLHLLLLHVNCISNASHRLKIKTNKDSGILVQVSTLYK